MRRITKSVCSHCSVKCGVLVESEGGSPISVRGDPNHPVSKGFLCIRGRSAIEYFDHPDRLNHVLKRAGSRGEGRWQRIGWEQAVGEIAAKLKASTDSYGPESLAYFFGTYHGTDQGAGIRFMNLLGSPNYAGNGFICAGPKIEAEWLTFGFGPATPDPRPGVTRAIIVWGQRASASNAPYWGRLLAAQRAGAKLIVIDPVRTPEAKAADIWLPVRPASDGALALALLHVIFAEHLTDAAFIHDHTTGAQALETCVAPHTPARAEAATGIPAATIGQVARMYASGPSIISSGLPNGMGRNALAFERAKCSLIAITGNLDRIGANRLLGPPDRIRTKADLELYDRLPAEQKSKRLGGDRFRLLVEGYDRINSAARRRWGDHAYPLTASRGAIAHPPTILRAIIEQKPYAIRSAIIQHSNILGSYPNASLVRDALRSSNLDLLVVHELFMTATAMFADYVLPAAAWMEKSYMYVSGENKLVLATPQAVPTKFDRRSDYEFFRDLGQAFGQGEFWARSLEEVWDEMLRPAGLTFADLSSRTQNWVQDDCTPAQASAARPAFGTPSGRVELASSILESCGYDPLPNIHDVQPTGAIEDYPLLLMTGATDIGMTHQDHRQIASLRKRHPDPTVRMNSATATELELVAGDWVWIEAPLGRIRQRVAVSDTIMPGVVEAERWWYPEREGSDPVLFGVLDSNVNTLAEDDPHLCDPAYGTWPYRFARCRLIKVPDKEPVPPFTTTPPQAA